MLLTAITHPWVEDPIEHVHEQVRQDDDDRDEHHEVLHDRIVAPQDRLDQEARHARQVEDGLRHDEPADERSEEHTSELQSPCNLVCRLLLEKKKNKQCCRLRPTLLNQLCYVVAIPI